MNQPPLSRPYFGSVPAQPSAAPTTVQSVEVVTMLGDTVVGVAHLEPAERAPSRTCGHLAIALGAVLLLMAALSFAAGLAASAADQRALAVWRDVLGRPVQDFRPTRLHPAYDWMAMLGLTGGLAALTWGTVRLRARRPRDRFTIGTAPGVDASVTGPSFPAQLALVRWDPTGALVSVAAGMRARLHRDGQSYEIDQLPAPDQARATRQPGVRELAVPATGNLRIGIDDGPVAFLVRMVAASRTRGLFGQPLPERRTVAFVVGSLAVHMLLLAIVNAIPPDPRSMGLGIMGAAPLRVRAAWKPSEDPVAEQPSAQTPGNQSLASMALPRDAENLAEPTTGGGPLSRDLQPRPPRSSTEARQMARTQGMLAFLGSNPGVFDPLAEIGTFDAEPGAVTDYGMPVGMGPGNTWGTFGTGPGGFAMQSDGTVASGRYGTIGIPGGPGPGTGRFIGVGLDPRRPGFTGPSVHISGGTAIGERDPSIIRRRIKSQHERIRHCYERTLLSAPELAGTVVTKFLISPEGAVLQASASGMGHDGLQTCIAGVIQAISFPRTSGAGLTRVSYPFELRNTGR